MNSFFRKLRWLTQRSDRKAELREELQFHLEEEAEQRQAEGLAEDEARWAARRELGNLTLVEENTRAAWGCSRLEQLTRDVSYGLRQIRRNPAFSGIAIATLALGIGGITAMFSAVEAVLIRPLPYVDAKRLVMIWDNLNRDGITKSFPAPAEWLKWRRLNTVFTDIAATQPGAATLSGDSEPEQVPARKATANLWNVLGVNPLIGRVFTEEEDEKAVLVAVISYGLWQRRYGGSPDVLGRKISVNDKPYEVIGVMPPEFYFLPARDIDIWMPASFPDWMRRNFSWHNAQVVARLKPGVTLESARASMAVLSLQLTAKDFRGPHSVIVSPLREDLTGNEKGYWYTIVGVVKDVREVGIEEELRPAVYRLHEQADQILREASGFVVRTSEEPASIVPAVRKAIWSVDKNQPIWRVQTVEQIVERQLSAPTQSTALLGAFALLAVLLASLGLYGVLSYAVTQRTSEIGVRMALGATSSRILLSFGKRGLVLTLGGLAIGLAVAAVASRWMTTLLYGFRPDYIPTATVVSLIFLGVASVACLVPARRAARVDPVIALRSE